VEKEKNLNKYGQSFQLGALCLFFKDKAFTSHIKSIIKYEYFDNKYTQNICKTGLEYLEKYHTFPSEDKVFDVLKSIIETTKGVSAKLYLNCLEEIKTADLSSIKYIKDEMEKFCFERYAFAKIEEQITNIELGNYDAAKNAALNTYIPINTNYKELTFTKDFSVLQNQDDTHNPVPSLFPTFNRFSKGGPGAGDLAIVVAQSSFGKTAYLTALARYLASIGKKVIYFSLETDRYQLLSRAVAGLTNIEQENLSQHSQLIEKRMDDVIAAKGEIKFFELKATTARIENLKLIVEEKKAAGYFADVVMIDGLNQLKMPLGLKHNDNNDRFEYLAEEARDWAKEEKIPIWMSFQTNRGGFNVEYADEQNIGKAIEVYQVCDWMLLFTQSIPMYEVGECYVQLLKNRLGRKGITLLVRYDPNKGTFDELKEVQRTELMSKKAIGEVRRGIEHVRKLIEDKKPT